MNDTVDNLVLEHLKPFQAGQDRIERKIEVITRRLSNLETGQASIIQHLGHLLRPAVTLPLELYSPARIQEFDLLEAELAALLRPR